MFRPTYKALFSQALVGARKAKGWKQEEAAEQFGYSINHYQRIESATNPHIPQPDAVKLMGEKTGCRDFGDIYCAVICPMKRDPELPLFDGVPEDPRSSLIWAERETEEMIPYLKSLMLVMANAQMGMPIPANMITEVEYWLGQMLDVETAIRQVRWVMRSWIDTQKVVEDHREKCRERGYLIHGMTGIKKAPAQQLAQA